MIVAVLDANVLVAGTAALAHPGSRPGSVIRRWFAGEFDVVLSEYIVGELEHALDKKYFRSGPSPELHARVVALIRRRARMVDPIVVPGVAPHRHDDPVLATVAAAGADWFVTGDAALLAMRSHAGVPFANPVRFLDILDAGDR